MSAYLLSRHAHACVAGNHVVFLDLRADQYFALDAEIARPLSQLVLGCTDVRDTAPLSEGDQDRATEVVSLLLERGVLTTDPMVGRHARPLEIERPRDSFVDESSMRPRARLRDVPTVALAIALAAARLRWLPISRVVETVQRRNERATREPASFDFDAARDVVAAFTAARPLLLTAHDACLLESLALWNLLAWRGLHPQWVFGVRTEPFAAHCWIQQGGTIFNDTLEHVSAYTPIMAV